MIGVGAYQSLTQEGPRLVEGAQTTALSGFVWLGDSSSVGAKSTRTLNLESEMAHGLTELFRSFCDFTDG